MSDYILKLYAVAPQKQSRSEMIEAHLTPDIIEFKNRGRKKTIKSKTK